MDAENWKVLIVDDEYDSAQMVVQLLEHHGVEVHVARDGAECMSMVANLMPTVVIMDLALPEKDGWQALGEIRSNPVTANIPVVAVTAYHSVNVAQDAIQAGFNAYYSKPIDALTFVDSLAALL